MSQRGDESTRVAQWLHGVLSGDATLTGLAAGGVHDSVPPAGTGFPRVVFEMLSSVDVRNQGPDRVMVEQVWIVKFTTKSSSYASCRAGADRIDELLEASPSPAAETVATVAGAHILACVRQATVRQPEIADDVNYRHLGGRYRISAQLTS